MKLLNLLSDIKYIILSGNIDVVIENIQYDSRKIKNNDIFVCMTGYEVDGHAFIPRAIENGASVIICEKDIDVKNIPEHITVVRVSNTRQALAKMASTFYGHPAQSLKLIGVTGTNGKTTTAYLVKSVLESSNVNVGLIGTISNHIGKITISSERTTPESLELHKYFKDMVDAGCTHCIMEVSSHSLELDRVYGLNFDVAIFTNITRDHLDFHKTFDNYYNAKFKLFERCKHAVINMDNEFSKKIVSDLENNYPNVNILTFSSEYNDVKYCIKNITTEGFTTSLYLNDERFTSPLPGQYNISNTAGAIIAVKSLDIESVTVDSINDGLSVAFVPGRCELAGRKYNLPYEIVIDYAHTPDGLENVIKTLLPFKQNRLISLYGSGGDRETAKRMELGRIGSELSDLVILSSDNPKNEDPLNILNEIAKGIQKDNYIIIEDRASAIEYAINIAEKGDIILLAGKGHENYQIIKGEKVPFDERDVLKNIFK